MYPIFKINIAIATVALALCAATCKKDSLADPTSAISIAEFESRLDRLRVSSKIPGMAAGIVKNGQIIWTKTYGYENNESQKPVTNSTIFHLASLTKPFASTVIMQLVKENKIALNDPVSKYGVILNEQDTVRVIHLLTHTSEGVPGSSYKYNGDRFARLSTIIQSATGKTFAQLSTERIMQPLGLQNTAPSNMVLAAISGFDTIHLKKNTAQGYSSNGTDKVSYPANFSAAAGLISNVNDMLKYAIAYDETLLLDEGLKQKYLHL